MTEDDPIFFASPGEFRAWLEEHHESETEVWVGFHRKATGRPSMNWQESVDQALCFGWIDGVRKRVGDTSYKQRFTPRTRRSTWSAINVARVEELTKQRLMHPAGIAAFERRTDDRTGTYSHERSAPATLPEEYEQRLRDDAKAWDFFQSQAPWYRRAAIHWVMSAKKEETRERRLARLIADSAEGGTVPPLTGPK